MSLLFRHDDHRRWRKVAQGLMPTSSLVRLGTQDGVEALNDRVAVRTPGPRLDARRGGPSSSSPERG